MKFSIKLYFLINSSQSKIYRIHIIQVWYVKLLTFLAFELPLEHSQRSSICDMSITKHKISLISLMHNNKHGTLPIIKTKF